MAARPERIASVYPRPRPAACPFTVAALPLPAAILMRPPERETDADGPRSTKGRKPSRVKEAVLFLLNL